MDNTIEEFMPMLMLMLVLVLVLMLAEPVELAGIADDTGGFEVLANAPLDENVDEGGSWSETSTGQTSASTPPTIRAVQLLKGADGKPANALPPHA
jgi:hypothetical protein